jgi:hypothetical protein
MLECVSEDDLDDIVKTLKDRAKAGDMTAAKLLLSYCVGRPTVAVDPDSLDTQEVRHFQEQAFTLAEVQEVRNAIPAEVACWMMGTGVEAVTRNVAKQLTEQFTERFPGNPLPAPNPVQDEAPTAKAPEQGQNVPAPVPTSAATRERGEKEHPEKRPAAREAKLLPLEEILAAPRPVLAELGLPVPPLTAGEARERGQASADTKRDFAESRCANEARSVPEVPRHGCGNGALSGRDLDGGER